MKKNITKGFTLIELAVALTIVALVVGGLAVPISKRIAEQQYTDTQANIDKAIEALVGYAIQNRRLPCPDVSTATADNRNGLEKTVGGIGAVTGCSIGIAGTGATAGDYHSDADGASWGDLPWQTIGLSPPYNVDAWNNRLRYAVFTPLVTQSGTAAVCSGNAGFANLSCLTFLDGAAAPSGKLDIRCVNPANPLVPTTIPLGCTQNTVPNYSVSTNAVFVVYSMGANGWGATSMVDLGTTSKLAFNATRFAKYPDEGANAPEYIPLSGLNTAATAALRRQFVVRSRTDEISTSGGFDDLLSFMSAPTLAAKLSSAGVWP